MSVATRNPSQACIRPRKMPNAKAMTCDTATQPTATARAAKAVPIVRNQVPNTGVGAVFAI